jgi:hypothetical protein
MTVDPDLASSGSPGLNENEYQYQMSRIMHKLGAPRPFHLQESSPFAPALQRHGSPQQRAAVARLKLSTCAR